MRNIREILRLRLSAGLSIRAIHRSAKVSVGAVQKLLARAAELELSWPLPDDLDDAALATHFYPGADTRVSRRFSQPDWAQFHQELKRKGVTKQLLWEEYTQQYPNHCYSYSQFCDRYRQWCDKQKRSMRQQHRAGEKCFVDYCGQTVPIIDPDTGEVRPAQVFVGVLGASNYTFAEATRSQSLPDWLGSHVRMLEYFGGCPEIAGALVRYSAHLPTGKLFSATTFILLTLSFVLAGKSVAALQEAALIGITPLPVSFNFEWLGLYSNWQGVGLQAAILVAAVWLILRGSGGTPSSRTAG